MCDKKPESITIILCCESDEKSNNSQQEPINKQSCEQPNTSNQHGGQYNTTNPNGIGQPNTSNQHSGQYNTTNPNCSGQPNIMDNGQPKNQNNMQYDENCPYCTMENTLSQNKNTQHCGQSIDTKTNQNKMQYDPNCPTCIMENKNRQITVVICCEGATNKNKEKGLDEASKEIPDMTTIKESKAPIIWLLGGPGTGKDTQAQNIVNKFPGYSHISAGDLLRQEANSGSPQGQHIDKVMKEGDLVSSDIAMSLVGKKMLAELPNTKAFLLNGLPRDKDQAGEFVSKAKAPRIILFLDAPDDVLTERLKERGKTSSRPDDNEETIRKRLENAKANDGPIMEAYASNVVKIDATKNPEEVFSEIEEALNGIELDK